MEAKRERYTPHDVGPSPLDWDAPYLEEVSSLITNGFVGTATPYYTDETGVPYLYGTNVRANKLDPKGIRYVNHDFHEKQSKTSLRLGDLLTVQSGHIGETAIVTEEFENANCHALIVTRPKKEFIYSQYLSYYINSEMGRARLKGLEVGSTILHINTKDLKRFRVLLPPLPEQRKIAKILSTWDKAINNTERLIDNSKQQKKALMQQLLTGKKRLLDDSGKPFEGEWEQVVFGDVVKIPSRKYNPVKATQCLPCIELENIEQESGRIIGSANASDLASIKNHFAAGSVIFGKLRPYLRKYARPNFDGVCSTEIWVFETKSKLLDEYLFHFVQMDKFISEANKSAGSKMPRADWSVVSELVAKLPCLAEQRKIANLLTNLDKNIELLQQQLTDLKKEKKALMQQLLTGKRRVNVKKGSI